MGVAAPEESGVSVELPPPPPSLLPPSPLLPRVGAATAARARSVLESKRARDQSDPASLGTSAAPSDE